MARLFGPNELALRARVARLDNSLTIQAEGLAEDLAKLGDASLSALDRAAVEGAADSALREIAFLQQQLAGLRNELGVTV